MQVCLILQEDLLKNSVNKFIGGGGGGVDWQMESNVDK